MKFWIARNKEDELELYPDEPRYDARYDEWTSKVAEYISLPFDLFPEVTWENSPQQIKVKLIKQE